MDRNDTTLALIREIAERLEELEKPKPILANLIPLASLILTLVAGFTSTVFISVSKITTLEIKNQYLTENVLELKREIQEVNNKLDQKYDTK
ncbi:hypothetical protein ELBI_98 [Anabaena phage Elbi]|nr:hypothetical protein ELBI_98 [Anabaena phage Elbi]